MKICLNCGAQMEDNVDFCVNCGAQMDNRDQQYNQQYDQQYNQQYNQQYTQPYGQSYGAAGNIGPQMNASQAQSGKPYEQNAYYNRATMITLPTGRALWKMILFGLLTLGIYPIVIYCRISEEINIIASRYDGKRTIHYYAAVMLGIITFSVYSFVWNHTFCGRIGNELKRRNIDYKFGPADFWLWCILGSLIFVGPFIYIYKLMKSVNLLCENYNYYG